MQPHVWNVAVDGLQWKSIVDPRCMCKCFGPELVGELRCDHHGSGFCNQGTNHTFNDSVLPRGVGTGELTTNAVVDAEGVEVDAVEFAGAVGTKAAEGVPM